MDVASLSGSKSDALSSCYTSTTDASKSQSDSSTASTETATDATLSCSCDEYTSSSESEDTESCYTTYKNQWKSLDTTLNNTELPASVFNYFESKTPEVSTIVSSLEDTIGNYMNGSCSLEDVESCIKQTYTDILNYNISLGRTDGTNEEDNAQILDCVYRKVITTANMMCQKANSDEGDAIATEKGLDPTDGNYAYYSSKYYYAFEDIKQTTIEATESIASEQGLTDFDTDASQSKIAPTLGDFNEYWSADAVNNLKICSMLDTSAEPPEDFAMFYSQSTEYADKVFSGGDISTIDDGEITVLTGGQSHTYMIPFDYYSDNVKAMFNLSEIITESDDGYSVFLKNFNLYRYYLYG